MLKITEFPRIALLVLLFSLPALGQTPKKANPPSKKATAAKPVKKEKKKVPVLIKTSMGDIEVELDPNSAPLSVANFLKYVERKFYDDLVFHRVIKNFMIQGGGFDKDLKLRPTDAPVKNEAMGGLKNLKGTIAMARTPDPDSASSQFYINLKDNNFLNYQGPMPRDRGYTVFGKVTKGMDVVEKIGKVQTTSAQQMRDVPKDPVIIKSIRKVEEKK